MRQAERELDRCLSLLRNNIRERGFTQLEVQGALGWGRSYISQLLTRQKNLRVDQVLMILNVIGVEPRDFFAELCAFPGPDTRSSKGPVDPFTEQGLRVDQAQELEHLEAALQGLASLLVDKEIVAQSELRAAVEAVARGD